MIAFLLWCLLFVVCWPVASLALVPLCGGVGAGRAGSIGRRVRYASSRSRFHSNGEAGEIFNAKRGPLNLMALSHDEHRITA